MADFSEKAVIMRLGLMKLVIVTLAVASEATALPSNRLWIFNRFRHRASNSTVQSPGDTCDPMDLRWYPVLGQPHKFAYCHRDSRRIVADSCATVNGIQKLFDEAYQQCVMPAGGVHKAPGLPRSSRFGEACVFNTDCLNNMYCPAGTCLCLVGFIDVESDCYTVINPGQNGCISKRQCEAVWPGSDCDDGVCQCPKPKTAVETRDGFVCVAPGSCPLPEDSEAPTPPAQLATTVDTSKPQCVPKVAATSDKDGCYDSNAGQSLTDLYDCIPNESAVGGDGGLCCPNRALTCILPKKTSTSSDSKGVTRYFYNSVTGICEQFLWDPTFADSAANNFRTQDHCRSYCQASCKRGAPEYSGAAKSSKPKSCSLNSECTRSGTTIYQCSTVGARQFCCPSADWICGPSGGRNYTPSQTPDPGPTSSTKTAVVRWYYDQPSHTCRSFSYKGEGGNFNNFHTSEECNAFCARSLCEKGDPLKDSSGNNQQCTGSRGCPSTYECRQSVCCPRKQTVCVQPKMVGTCTSAISRHWYNAAIKDCEQFVYTGCNGNDNNFDSYLTCQSHCRDAKPEPKCIQGEADKDSSGNYYTCSLNGAGSSSCRLNYECYFDGYMYGCCPTKAWTCSLNNQAGTPCVASTVRWYYDPTSKSCQTFTYSGCDGNSNNFQTRQQCEQYCGVGGCPFGGEPYQDSNTMQRKVCNSQSAPCPSGYECTSVTVSGNAISYCCPTRAYVCGQSPNQGTQCGATLQRYSFNIASKVCSTFTYFGCGGNENNFATLSQCNNFCSSAACAPGESVYLDANTQKPVTCNIGLQSGCPPTYVCKMDSLTGKNLCCGSSDLGVCPTRERAYVEALSQTARECQPGVAGTCPANYLCRANQGKNRYYCCAPDSKALCHSGRAAYRDSLNHQPQTCYMNTASKSCPSGYVCQSSIGGVSQGFCCSVSGICPQNSEFYAEPTTRKPRQCVFSSSNVLTQCPTGYGCRLPAGVSGSSAGYCCKLPAPPASAVCPGGKAVIEGKDPQPCASGQPCPNGSVCTPYPANGQSYCCQQTSINGRLPPMEKGGDGCPPGTSVLVSTDGVEKVCDIVNAQSCPLGYSCQFNKEEQKYQCCGARAAPPSPPVSVGVPSPKADDDGCPIGQVAAVDGGTQTVRICTFSDADECPVGFACLYSSSMRRNQCCGVSAGCPGGSVAFIDSSTGRPQACNGENACAPGFACKSSSNGNVICCSASATSLTGASTPAAGSKSVCPGGQPLDDPRQSGSPKQCSDSNNCPAGYECSPVRGGSVCCPDRVSVCSLPIDHGGTHCEEGVQSSQRYFYNSKKGLCQEFTYSGCDGNGNNFVTMDECQAFCSSGHPHVSVDDRGSTNPTLLYSHSLMLHGLETVNQRSSSISETGSKTTMKCLSPNSKPFVEAGASSPLRCRLGHSGHCPRGYACQYSGVQNLYICCSLTAYTPGIAAPAPRGFCPKNSAVHIHPRTRLPQACTSYLTCPAKHRCLFSQVRRRGYCCKSSSGGIQVVTGRGNSGDTCPLGLAPYLPAGARTPVLCALGKGTNSNSSTEPSCPVGYGCAYSPKLHQYVCCGRVVGASSSKTGDSGIDSKNGCARGRAFIYPGTRIPLACPGRQSTRCPRGFTCELSTLTKDYQCCSTNTPSRWSGQATTNETGEEVGFLDQSTTAGSTTLSSTTVLVASPLEEEISPDYLDLYPSAEEMMETSLRYSVHSRPCDLSKRKYLGDECCADEQCPYGCRRHRHSKLCLCQSHLILDMTRKPFRCSPTCWAWREGGTCIRHPAFDEDRRRLGSVERRR